MARKFYDKEIKAIVKLIETRVSLISLGILYAWLAKNFR